ncbi:MAG: tetratricopeptide repeat protein [Rubrivivax sp.]|nr:tetratricopeptide repeat protein [Pyrinomonadaceae bacterium]
MFLLSGRILSLFRLQVGLRCALSAALLVTLCHTSAHAQSGVDSTGTGGRHSIQGRIVFPSGRRGGDVRLKVRLESAVSGDLSVFADSNGTFGFRSLEAGSYAVIVEGGEDFETTRETIYIEPDITSRIRGVNTLRTSRPYTVQVYLRPKGRGDSGAEARAGVVNAALASVPKPALALYNKAIESARNDNDGKAVEQLKAAIALHPDFALALTNLGIIYMKMKQPDNAIEPLRSALILTPDDYVTLLTYGTALLDKQKFSEAEEQFRKALQKNNASPSAHFCLGLILLKRQDLDGGEKAFKSAVEFGGDEIAVAHKYLGGIYWAKRDYKQAADELETYLRLTPNAEDAARMRATIKEFRAKK